MHDFWGGYKGGVSLTFDDGLSSQLDIAIPLLDERDIKATFYICPDSQKGINWKDRLAPWMDVQAKGYEIGNHSLSHPTIINILYCSTRGHMNDIIRYNDMSLEGIKEDILTAQERLKSLFPEQKEWSFAYPDYHTYVGRGKEKQSYVPFIAENFVGGKALGEYGFGAVPGHSDLAAIPSIATERMSGFEMIGLVEELTERGQWVVLSFHDIDRGRLSVAKDDFTLLLDYLDSKKLPDGAVMYITDQEEVTVNKKGEIIYIHYYKKRRGLVAQYFDYNAPTAKDHIKKTELKKK